MNDFELWFGQVNITGVFGFGRWSKLQTRAGFGFTNAGRAVTSCHQVRNVHVDDSWTSMVCHSLLGFLNLHDVLCENSGF